MTKRFPADGPGDPARHRVIALGSKPGAAFVPADAVYCANAAIGFYRDAVVRYPKVVNVNSGLVLWKSFDDGGGLYATKWRAVADARPTRMVLFASPGAANDTSRVMTALTADGYDAPIELVSVGDRARLVTAVTGLRSPILARAFLRQPPRVILTDAKRITRALWSRARGRGDADVPGKFRPSTGILALIVAIRDHGPDAEYVVAGIGLGDRHLHQVGDRVVAGRDRNAVMPPHVHADIAVLRALGRRFHLRTTEPELGHLVPLIDSPRRPQPCSESSSAGTPASPNRPTSCGTACSPMPPSRSISAP